MRKKQWSKVVAAVTAVAIAFGGIATNPNAVLTASAETVTVTDADLDAVLGDSGNALSFTRQAVHDPSIVTITSGDAGTTYYVFGSHMGVAKTKDLRNWSSVTSEVETSTLFGDVNGNPVSYNQAFRNSAYTGTVINSAGNEVPFGSYDASEWNTAVNSYTVKGNMWAPDVVYNPTMGKWCMYLSLNGHKWNSNIILLTADSVEGPYVYQGPVVYSGFNGTNNLDIADTDLHLVYPDIATTGLPSKYSKGESWGEYWPHAIDPCVSYDENGKLWLIYGSWSGGIYALELDENTGLRDYTVKYANSDTADIAVTSDAYFGKKIAGGAYVSGEGAYVEKIGNYWYLFMSYGFYSPEGGYEMRIFRSNSIDGPYVDESGKSAIFPRYLLNYGVDTVVLNENKENEEVVDVRYGDKIMSGYQWDTMSIGEVAQGHNSAFTDVNGNSYVVYHTKFNDGTVSHALRVHQLYVNKDGWLVAAPYEYTGETVNNSNLPAVDPSAILGDYELIVHDYEIDYEKLETVKPEKISLASDGTVTGDKYSGNWETDGSYITVTLNGTAYKGVVVEQTVDGTAKKTLCFTAKAASGVSVWGSHDLGDNFALASTREALGLSNADNIFPIGGQIYQNIKFPTEGKHGTVVAWESSNPDVLSNDGIVTAPEADTQVTVKCTLSRGNAVYNKTYDVTVMGANSGSGNITDGLVAKYEFEGDFADSLSDNVGTATAQAEGTAPSIKTDKALGSKVVQVNFGYDDASSSNYVEIPNPFKGEGISGATISMQVKRSDADVWDALWGFRDDDQANGIHGKFFLTGNAFLGYNGNDGFFDANNGATVTNAITPGEWDLVTVTIDNSGFDIYINGVLTYNENVTAAYNSGDGFSSYESVINLINQTETFYIGYGSPWGSAPFRADDLLFYNRVLTTADVATLYSEFVKKVENAASPEGSTTNRTYAELEQYQTYYNDFEEGVGNATIVGSGVVETVEDERFGKVYHNAVGNAGVRTNYLLLPSDAIKNASSTGSEEMTIGFSVNVADATGYFYAPIFTAYGDAPGAENTWPMLALQSRLLAQINCGGYTDFTPEENVVGVNQESTAWLDDKEWHYYTATFSQDLVTVYVDGVVMNQWALDGTKGHTVAGLFSNGNELDYVCLGGNQAWNWGDNDASYMFDNVSLFSTALSAQEIATVMNEIGIDRSYEQLKGYHTYYNDFEEGLGDATVVGSGNVETVENGIFNKVYHNATGEAGVRTNYLLLPEDTIANASSTGSKEMSIGFWVNVADATGYFYSPIFTAYGAAPGAENTWPMLALQSRLLAQINCGGYADFTPEENVLGVNQESTAWLDDKEWHYYTATFSEDLVTVYVDGVVMNQWTLDGTKGHTVAGLFSNGSELEYVCLGGNQAWNWGDNDASYMFDKVAFFSTALTPGEIAAVITAEGTQEEQEPIEPPVPTEAPTPRPDRPYEEVDDFRTYFNNFEEGLGDATVVGSGALETDEDDAFGSVYHNAIGEKGVRTNYLLLPSNTIANAVAAGNKELSVGFWVNVADAKDYFYTPLFSAYGDEPTEAGNTWPMMIAQSRLIAQVNCAGYTDLTKEENVTGVNLESTAWLDDAEWHYYTITFTENLVTVYVDGVIKNQWNVSSAKGNCVSGIFTAGADLDYVCLGGNQAWDWSDADASYMFDDVAIYSTALSAREISDIMQIKVAEELPETTDDPETTDKPVTTDSPIITSAPIVTDSPVETDAPSTTNAPETTDAPATTDAPTPTTPPTATPVPEVSVEQVNQETQEAINQLQEADSISAVIDIVADYISDVAGYWANTTAISNEVLSTMANLEAVIREQVSQILGRNVSVDIRNDRNNAVMVTGIENALLTDPQGGYLLINPTTLSQDRQDAAADYGIIAGAIDITFVNSDNAITQLDAPVRIHFDIPEGMLHKRLKMLHFADDGQELLDVTVNGNQGSFITRSFSEFVLVAVGDIDDIDNGNNNDDSQDTNNSVVDTIISAVSPKTGDLGKNSVAPWVQLVILGVMCVAAAVTGASVLRKKEEE